MKPLIISPSQLESFDAADGEGCPRKWFAEKVLRLPRGPSSASQTFGSVTHAVCERYLLADDLGRMPDGRPVELYPDGWSSFKERDGTVGTLTPMERDTVKTLFGKLVETGYIARWPGRQIEQEFGAVWKGQELFPVVEHRGITVGITGLIDVLLPSCVLDWKTAKTMKYAKSANKLRKTIQMICYAKVRQVLAARAGHAVPDRVELVHVVLCKDPTNLKVRRTSVWITSEEIEAGWQRIQRLARQMVDIKLTFLTEDRWFDVPGPAENGRACNAFGGCIRQMVCLGKHSVENHRKNIDRLVLNSINNIPAILPLPLPATGTRRMGLLADRANQAQQNQPAAGAIQVPAAPVVQPVPMNTPVQQQQPVVMQQQPVAIQQVQQQPAPVVVQQQPAPVVMQQQPVAIQPVQQQQLMAEPVAVPAPVGQAPASSVAPWATQGCGSCAKSPHPGWNTQGNPCRICNGSMAAAGGPISDHFQIADAPGGRFWTARPEQVPALQGMGVLLEGFSAVIPLREVAATVAGQPYAAAAAPAAAAPAAVVGQVPTTVAPVSQPVAAQALAVAPAAEAAAPVLAAAPTNSLVQQITPAGPVTLTEELVKPKAARGRPKTAFMLYIGCAPQGESPRAIALEDIFQRLSEQLAADSGVRSYYELHPFQRRDCLAAVAQSTAAFLGKSKVTVSAKSPDIVAFVDALRPFASEVVEATAPYLVDSPA